MRRVLVFSWLLCLGCAKPAPVSPRVLMDRDLAFARAVAERGTPGFREFVGTSVVTMPPGSPFQMTRDEWEKMWDDVLAHQVALSWQPVGGAVEGRLGYTYGTWLIKRKDGAERTGKYFTVWRLDDDGVWRVVLDGGNTNPPPAPPTP
jgi:ketosteroid isomerase-like protein